MTTISRTPEEIRSSLQDVSVLWVSPGDYVLAEMFGDCKPCERWYIGFIWRIIWDKHGFRVYFKEFPTIGYKRVVRITSNEAKLLILTIK